MEPTARVFTSPSVTNAAAYIPVAAADTALPATFAWLAVASSPVSTLVGLVEGLPKRLVESYAEAASRRAVVCEVDPAVWFASTDGLDGAWGEGDSAEEARRDLRETVMGWVAVRRRLGLEIPVLDGLDLNSSTAQDRPA